MSKSRRLKAGGDTNFFSQTHKVYNATQITSDDCDHEYLDIEVINNSTDATPQPIEFNVRKDSSIVDVASDYYLSVIRFSFFSNIPTIIPQVVVGNNIPYNGQTLYYVNIGYGATPQTATFNSASSFSVAHVPDNAYLPTPLYFPSSQFQLYNDPYFYIYSIQNFLDMVNTALNSSYNWCKTEYPSQLEKSISPKFVWNTSTNKINLLVSEEFVEGLSTNTFYISMNPLLYGLFDTFPSTCVSLVANNQSKNYILNVRNVHGFGSYAIPQGEEPELVDVYNVPQQESSVVSWCPCTSIQFATGTIPVNLTQAGSPKYLGQNLAGPNGNQTTSNVITDYTIPLEIGCEYTNQLLYYIPTSEYRLFDLNSSDLLNTLSLTIQWRDINGFNHVCTLKQNQTANVKIMLRKKSFNN